MHYPNAALRHFFHCITSPAHTLSSSYGPTRNMSSGLRTGLVQIPNFNDKIYSTTLHKTNSWHIIFFCFIDIKFIRQSRRKVKTKLAKLGVTIGTKHKRKPRTKNHTKPTPHRTNTTQTHIDKTTMPNPLPKGNFR